MSIQKYPAIPILIVDDEEDILRSYKELLRNQGINHIELCQDSRQVMSLLQQQAISLIVLDLFMPHITGQELLERLKVDFCHIPIIVVTGSNKVETAVECMKNGAFDYMVKPVEKSRFISSINRAIEFNEMQQELAVLRRQVLQREVEHPEHFSEILTINCEMKRIFKYIEAVAVSPKPVLITGESGVGKELIARVVHKLSCREGEFVPVNIAGVDDTIFADTLFGHKSGAFTGATSARRGLIEQAQGGTLFLDEIGELGAASQVKLLRLLQEHEYYKIGSDIAKKSYARIITATNVDLQVRQAASHFRKDLYYRLITHHIHLPPLRSRPEDIPLLLDHFIDEACQSLTKAKPQVPDELLRLLAGYAFPGNIRELQSMVFNAISINTEPILPLSYFEEHLIKYSDAAAGKPVVQEEQDNKNKIIKLVTTSAAYPTLAEMEDFLIREVIKTTKGNQSLAARILGVSQPTLSRRLKQEQSE